MMYHCVETVHHTVYLVFVVFQFPSVQIVRAVVDYIRRLPSIDDLDQLGRDVFQYVLLVGNSAFISCVLKN